MIVIIVAIKAHVVRTHLPEDVPWQCDEAVVAICGVQDDRFESGPKRRCRGAGGDDSGEDYHGFQLAEVQGPEPPMRQPSSRAANGAARLCVKMTLTCE